MDVVMSRIHFNAEGEFKLRNKGTSINIHTGRSIGSQSVSTLRKNVWLKGCLSGRHIEIIEAMMKYRLNSVRIMKIGGRPHVRGARLYLSARA